MEFDTDIEDHFKPGRHLQETLAIEFHAADLVRKFITTAVASELASHAALLGTLILQGGNQRVQQAFMRAELTQPTVSGGKSFLRQLSLVFSDAMACARGGDEPGTTTAAYKKATRLERLQQLLCEGHNLQWQAHVRTQPAVPAHRQVSQSVSSPLSPPLWSPPLAPFFFLSSLSRFSQNTSPFLLPSKFSIRMFLAT